MSTTTPELPDQAQAAEHRTYPETPTPGRLADADDGPTWSDAADALDDARALLDGVAETLAGLRSAVPAESLDAYRVTEDHVARAWSYTMLALTDVKEIAR